MALNKQGRYVYCGDCGSRQEMNGVCKICGHQDNPLLPGMVPNVIGLTQAAAIAKLNDPEAQLTVGNIATENSETVPVDLVISSDPIADTR